VAVALAFALDVTVAFPPHERAYTQIMETGALWHGWGTLLVLSALIAYFGGQGHYTRRIPFWSELGAVIRGTAVALICDGFIAFAIYQFPFGFEGTLRWVLFVPALLLTRFTMRVALDFCGLWTVRTLIIGDAPAVESTRAALESQPGLGYKIVQAIKCPPDEITALAGSLPLDDIDFVVLGMGQAGLSSYRPIITTLMRARVHFAVVPTFDGLPVLGFSHQYFFSQEIMLLVGRNNLARPISRLVKLAFDQTIALLLLAFLAPVFLGISVLSLLTQGRPLFFSQPRVGANGILFRCLKFRTMVTNAEGVLQRLLTTDPAALAEWTANHKLKDDPRITLLGRFLRQTSLDELPQLINVLQGHMSLVGPRPISEKEICLYGDDIDYYYDARPGMTGLWQVSGRGRASYARRVQLDVWYVRNWTLWHDITILLKTIPAVLRRDGAT
jgi:Undecaprenyl-phosphate galactose phosphotransferase WbaP